MNIKRISLLALVCLGLIACGSDETKPPSPPPTPPEPELNEAWNYIETPPTEHFNNDQLEGIIYARLGYQRDWLIHYINKGSALAKAGNMSYDINGDGWINRWDYDAAVKAGLGSTTHPEAQPFEEAPVRELLASHIHRVLKTNPDGLGAGTARPDIFVDGHYSAFDILRYLVATDDSLRFDGKVIPPSESPYETHEFTISWDENGDGDFTNDGDNSNNSTWFYSYTVDNGDGKGPVTGMDFVTYHRMDLMWVRPGFRYAFYPLGEIHQARRHLLWQWEVNRKAENKGKVIVDTMRMSAGEHPDALGSEPVVLASNIEVRPFNLRTDVFQPGVTTGMDVTLTAAADHGVDITYAFWPTLSTGVKANTFVVSKGPLGKGGGWHGWPVRLFSNTPYMIMGDFSANPKCMHFGANGLPSVAIGGTETPFGALPGGAEECTRLFGTHNGLGGYSINDDPTNHVHLYGTETAYIGYKGIISHELPETLSVYVGKERLLRSDFGSYDASGGKTPTVCPDEGCTTATLRKLTPATKEAPVAKALVLDDTHFGWKIADCAMCHNDKKDPLGHGGFSWPTNTAAGFDNIQPYFCSTCHGNNGAPDLHGLDTRCSFCHSAKNSENTQYGIVPKNHGEASKLFLLKADEIVGNQDTISYYYQEHSTYETYQHFVPRAPMNAVAEIDLYEDMWVPHNNAYTLSKSFPGTYSCTTCHQSKVESK